MLVDIAADRLEERAAQLTAAGHDVIAHHADCADDAAVEGYAAAAMSAWGRIDGFFNNAGMLGVVSPLVDYPETTFDRVIAVMAAGCLSASSLRTTRSSCG